MNSRHMNIPINPMARVERADGIHTRHVLLFLVVTFGVSWCLALLSPHAAGEEGVARTDLPLIGMLVPTFVVMLIELFCIPDSMLFIRNAARVPRMIAFAYLLLTLLVGLNYAIGLVITPTPVFLRP